MQNKEQFPAKILLFGEYTVIEGGTALALPLSAFHAKLTFAKDQQKEKWLHFLAYLKLENLPIDTDALTEDIENNLNFESNIPQGYGLGSSGALVAAVWERYKTVEIEGLTALKSTLARMENFFHGNSSGIDPLVCSVQKGMLLKDGIQVLNEDLGFSDKEYHIFLLNTGQGRSYATKHFVDYYKKNISNSKSIKDLLYANDEAINAFLKQDFEGLFSEFKEISTIQKRFFNFMIPEHLRPIWIKGLDSGHSYFKICGAGGGGFLIGITKDKTALEKLVNRYELIYC